MSVLPAIDEALLYGPPPVSRYTLLKLLKLNANDAIISGATATRSSGSVTRRKICHALPPSTRAASVSSPGIDCRAPSDTRKKYGVVSHTLTSTTAMRGQEMNGSHEKTLPPKSHGTCMWKMRFTTPKSSFRRPAQTSSERNPGIAYGITSTDR